MPESIAEQVIAVRQARAHRGAGWCREALADVATERGLDRTAEETSAALSGSDLILARARQRAAGERRARRITG